MKIYFRDKDRKLRILDGDDSFLDLVKDQKNCMNIIKVHSNVIPTKPVLAVIEGGADFECENSVA